MDAECVRGRCRILRASHGQQRQGGQGRGGKAPVDGGLQPELPKAARGRQPSAHAEKPTGLPQRVKDTLTRVLEHVMGDAELRSRLVSLVLGVFGPKGMDEAQTALAVVFPDADELEAEITCIHLIAFYTEKARARS